MTKYIIEIPEVKSCFDCKFHDLNLRCIIIGAMCRVDAIHKDCPLKKVEK